MPIAVQRAGRRRSAPSPGHQRPQQGVGAAARHVQRLADLPDAGRAVLPGGEVLEQLDRADRRLHLAHARRPNLVRVIAAPSHRSGDQHGRADERHRDRRPPLPRRVQQPVDVPGQHVTADGRGDQHREHHRTCGGGRRRSRRARRSTSATRRGRSRSSCRAARARIALPHQRHRRPADGRRRARARPTSRPPARDCAAAAPAPSRGWSARRRPAPRSAIRIASARSGIAASSSAPGDRARHPADQRPPGAARSRSSPRSRTPTIRVTQRSASMISVPGIRRGSTMATTGAASMPMPNPIDACRHDAQQDRDRRPTGDTPRHSRRYGRRGHAGSVQQRVVALGGVAGRPAGRRARGGRCVGADVGGLPAPGAEPAARRRVERRGHLALEQDPLARAASRPASGPPTSAPRCRGGSGGRKPLRSAPVSMIRPEVHHRDPVGDVADHRQVVGDEDVGDAELLLQIVEQVEHLRLHREVERGHRLVADDDVGVQRQRAGDADALALTAGELLRVLVGGLGAAGRPGRAVRAPACRGPRGSRTASCGCATARR